MQHMKLCKQCRKPIRNGGSGYCEDCHQKYVTVHGPMPTDRAKTAERGYNNRWTVFARNYLRTHHRCARCGAPATCVDHLKMTAQEMLSVFGEFLLDDSYYQPLCTRCNVLKGRREDRKRNEKLEADLLDLTEVVSEKNDPTPHDQRK